MLMANSLIAKQSNFYAKRLISTLPSAAKEKTAKLFLKQRRADWDLTVTLPSRSGCGYGALATGDEDGEPDPEPSLSL